MLAYKNAFDAYMEVKSEPNSHEISLFQRAQKYIGYLRFIPGIQMVAVVNSLSLYATHADSDIDLFIVTDRDRIWFVRVLTTALFWLLWVWRKGEDIAGNFCLSFFITENALDLESIAIEDDIYLSFWIYHMKPIFVRADIYERFLLANPWVEISSDQKIENKKFLIPPLPPRESSSFWYIFELFFRYFGEKKSLKSYKNLGSPTGIIITKNILKFHNEDRRERVRDAIIAMK
jgi:hypothetical protein